jgi:hypothetical protein
MGLFTAAILGITALQAGQSIIQGQAANKEAKYNAGLLDQQAANIDVQKSLEGAQYDRAKGQLVGKSISRTAKAGFNLSGSPMAVMIDSLTQLEMDKSVGQYNLDIQKRNAQMTANQYRRNGKTALMSGYSNAFSSVLMGAAEIGMAGGFDGLKSTPKQTFKTAQIRGTNGMVTTVPVRPYKF